MIWIIASQRGIYIIDNLQPLRELIRSDINKDAILFPVQNYTYDFAQQIRNPHPILPDGWERTKCCCRQSIITWNSAAMMQWR